MIRPAPSGRDQRVRQSSTGASRSSRPVSASRIAPQAVTGFEMDSTRKSASEVIGRPVAGSAMPKAPVQTGAPPSIKHDDCARDTVRRHALGYDTRQPIRNAAIG